MKFIKFLFRCTVFFLALIVILWAVVLGVLQTDQGRTWVLERTIQSLEHATGAEIQIANVQFSFPFNLHADRIAISQNNQSLITIEKLELYCAFSTLFEGRLVFSKLNVSNIEIQHLPAKNPSTFVNESSWDEPIFPFYVKFKQIDISNLKVPSELLIALDLSPAIRDVLDSPLINIHGMWTNNPSK